MSLESELMEIASIQVSIDTSRLKLSTKIGNLVERIEAGETTGDKIRDFCIVSCGEIKNGNFYSRLNELDQKIKEHQNELVLMIKTDEHIERGTISADSAFVLENGQYYLGILNGELQFDFQNRNILFPTGKYVSAKAVEDCDWKLQQGSIKINYSDLNNIKQELQVSKMGSRNLGALNYSINLLFGMEQEFYFGFVMYPLAIKAVREKDVDAINTFKKQKVMLPHQIYATRLLGYELSEEMEVLKDKTINRRSKNIIDIFREKITGQRVDDDVFNKHLREAVKLGLHIESSEIDLGRGVRLNLPEYIYEQCILQGIEVAEVQTIEGTI